MESFWHSRFSLNLGNTSVCNLSEKLTMQLHSFVKQKKKDVDFPAKMLFLYVAAFHRGWIVRKYILLKYPFIAWLELCGNLPWNCCTAVVHSICFFLFIFQHLRHCVFEVSFTAYSSDTSHSALAHSIFAESPKACNSIFFWLQCVLSLSVSCHWICCLHCRSIDCVYLGLMLLNWIVSCCILLCFYNLACLTP